jgi:hypothetical protein
MIYGIPSVLEYETGVGGAADRPKPPRGSAPGRHGGAAHRKTGGRPFTDRFTRHGGGSPHSSVARLQRRAVNELFDWLGLGLVPRQIWPILELAGDPGRAVEQLVAALGCKPELVRRRDAREITRLQAAIDLLVGLDAVRPYLRRDHLQEIEYLLFTGNYGLIERYSHVVAALSAILTGREKAASLPDFAVYALFIADVEGYIADPLSLEPAEADEALRLSDGFITAMETYAVLSSRVEAVIEALLGGWPSEFADAAEVDLRSGMILRFEDIAATLKDDATIGLAQIEALLDELSLLFEDLKGLFERVCGAAGPDEPSGLGPRDEALVFFGFAAGSTPAFAAIKKAYYAIIRKMHPDTAGPDASPEELARLTELTKKANAYFDDLRRASA